MTWFLARLRCLRRGHIWRPLTTDEQHWACHYCGKQTRR